MAVAVDKMTVQDKLLLAQAVYKVGASNWPIVSKLLTEHPCCKDRSELFTPEDCENSYVALMKGIEVNVPAPDSAKPQAKVHLQLAQTFYVARMQELKDQIMGYEARFTELMSDINGIKAGEMDDKIQAEIRHALNRKYGKKLVDSWVPDPAEVKKAVDGGPGTAKTPEPTPEPVKQPEPATEEPDEAAEGEKVDEAKTAEEAAEKPEEQAADAAPVVTEPTTAEATPDESEAMDVDEVPEEPAKEPTSEPEAEIQPKEEADQPAPEPETSTVEPSEEPETEPDAQPADADPEAEEADVKAHSADESSKEPSAEAEPEAEEDKQDGEEEEKGDDEKEVEDEEGEEEEEEEEKPATRSSRRKPRKSSPTADKKEGDGKNDMEIDEQAATPKSDHGSEALSDIELSPLPADESAVADAPPSSPTPVSKRGRKRKGETVPKVGRPPKRGRKGSSAVEGDDAEGEGEAEPEAEAEDEPDKEVKEEVQEEAEEETPRNRRGRRRRGESPAKEASPPTKRGASASSTASGTPQTEGRSSRRTRQPRGSMRDDVVSKSVRAASEAISVKEEEEEKKDDHSEEEAEGEKRSTRSRRKAEAAASAASTPVEKRTSKRTRTPRPAARESAGGEADDEDDSGPSASVSTPASSVAPPSTKSQKTMQKLLLQLLDSIQQHKYGPVFANPVRKNEAADYYEIIKRPMDLKTLRARIKDGSVGNIEEFERDVRLMFANATIYNGRGSQVSDMAKEMMAASEVHIAHFKSMQHHLGR